MWAWRSISPVVAPFPVVSLLPVGPQNPKAYGASSPPNTKIIILMTDGMNSWTASSDNPWGSLYEGLGYYVNGRINSYLTSNISPGGQTCGGSTTTASSFRCQMDNLTLEACTNAKKQNIVIYTVGFSTTADPIDSAGVSLLTNCATKSSYYYPAPTIQRLMAAFQRYRGLDSELAHLAIDRPNLVWSAGGRSSFDLPSLDEFQQTALDLPLPTSKLETCRAIY